MGSLAAIRLGVARQLRKYWPQPLVRRLKSTTTVEGKKEGPAALKRVETNTINKENQALASETPAEPTKTLAEEPPLTNPFNLLAHATETQDLASRLRSFANNFAVIGALWCTLSISALTMAPIHVEESLDHVLPSDNENNEGPSTYIFRRSTTRAIIPAPQNNENEIRRRPPVLVKYFFVPERNLEDIYIACWSASFFISAIGLGLSTVVAGIVAATAPAYVKIFVRRHSDILMALPVCQGLSSGFAALGLSVGLDEARGEPISWIGYIGTIAGGGIVGGSTLKVLKGYKASRAAGKLSPPKDG